MEPARYARGSSLIAALYGLENILYSSRVGIYFQRDSDFFDGFGSLIFLV